MFKTFLTIAGSDCIGGAGIQADIKTAMSFGLYTASAITSLTVQNSSGLKNAVAVSDDILSAQINAVLEDFIPDAIKIGMISSSSQIDIIHNALSSLGNHVNIVVDPVLRPSLGKEFSDKTENLPFKIISKIAPLSTLITPNRNEWQIMMDSYFELSDNDERELKIAYNDSFKDILNLLEVDNCNIDLIKSINLIKKLNLNAVLITGGGYENSRDILLSKQYNYQPIVFNSIKINTPNHHGTGCIFSSAISSLLAKGETLKRAIEVAKAFISKGLVEGKDISFGNGYGPANFFI